MPIKPAHFLPYGRMNNEYQRRMDTTPKVPVLWQPPPRLTALPRDEAWDKWMAKIRDSIAEILWPVWNVKTRSWAGAAAGKMLQLTHADMELLDFMQEREPSRGLLTLPDSPVRSIDCDLHAAMLLYDDDRDTPRGFADYLDMYDRTLPERISKFCSQMFGRFYGLAIGTTALQFKVFFQRSRPFQNAMLLGSNDYRYQEARTAETPSLCSGHSLEGLLGIGGVLEHMIAQEVLLTHESMHAIECLAVDIGDRRVMGGIHHPSDNLASWIVAMHMAPRIFRNHAIAWHLWNAIAERSRVYGYIQEFVKLGRGDAYKPALAELLRLKP